MTPAPDPAATPVTIGHRVEVIYEGAPTLRATGVRHDDVVGFRWGETVDDRELEQLSFVLLDDGFVIAQPVGFRAAPQGWWYCDLVALEVASEQVTVRDLFIDVIVGPPGQAVRVLDLDDYADAMTSGALSLAQAADGLARTQAFLDRRLNHAGDADASWPDFPPREVSVLRGADLPRAWRWE